MSLGARLTAWYCGVFVASALLLAGAASVVTRYSVQHQLSARLAVAFDHERAELESRGLGGLAARARAEAPPDALYVRVLDEGDGVLFEYHSDPALSFDQALSKQASPSQAQSLHARTDGSEWKLAAAPLSGGRILQIAINARSSQEVMGHLRVGLLAAWIGAVVLGLVGGFYLTRRALAPVAQLTDTARRVIASGDLGLRVPVGGSHDELAELTRLFNQVLARNQTLVTAMREALDNVAHDLRTPLTRLRTGAELALHDGADAGRLREALADGIEESERVLAMLTTLMDISEAETGVMQLRRAPVDLSQLLREATGLYEHVADERGVRIVTHLEGGAVVSGDAPRLLRALANLVDNAVKYSAVGGRVELSTARVGERVRAVVADGGPGIPADELPRIWQRLYRGDRSRSQRGLGLGLSFVKAIVEAHGGTVSVTSAPGAGATFTVELPALGSARDAAVRGEERPDAR